MNHLSRRRFLTISAAAAGCMIVPGLAAASTRDLVWKGTAFGATASIRLAGMNSGEAKRLIALCRAEIERMESIFSLYRTDSALVRLNAGGKLDNPPLDMVALLSQAAAIHQQTNGAFDPTIQPAWTRLAENSSKETSNAPALPIGFDHVTRSTSRIVYTKPGMAMTLNGIAQGYATDRIADLLKSQGLNNVLVEVGEIRALGNKSDGKPWSVGIADTSDRDVIVDRIALADRAIATSSPLGTTVDAAGTIGHILQPQTGQPGGQWRQVSVIAPTATVADGLSTAFCLMDRDAIKAALTAFDQVEVRLEADDGMVTRLG